MWQVLVAAAVAGSGFFARRLLNGDGDSTADAAPEQSRKLVRAVRSSARKDSIPENLAESSDLNLENQGSPAEGDAIFRFSSKGESSSSGKKGRRRKGNGEGYNKKGVEVQKLERKFSLCLKRRKTGKSTSTNCGSGRSKESSFFSWGLGVGIMYMMSAGKCEISKLNSSVDETAKVVQELKAELYKRKLPCNTQISSSVNKTNGGVKRNEGKLFEPRVFKFTTEKIDPRYMEDFVSPVTDDGECGSSVLTEEPVQEVLVMDQLEAELESELQKLPGCSIEDCHDDGIISAGINEAEGLARGHEIGQGQKSDSPQLNGVSPSELDKKLCHLLIEQQGSQIVELESELHRSLSKLREKEAELQALKDCVKRLSEFSLSDDDVEAAMVQEMTIDRSCTDKIVPNPRKPVVGMKRCIEYESSGDFHVR